MLVLYRNKSWCQYQNTIFCCEVHCFMLQFQKGG
nr:MAG TPA_asm: hypothetical protein [Caudoviricetes sp.]